MTITQILTSSAKNFLTGNAGHSAFNDNRGEYVRQAATGDPRLDLAHADRNYRLLM